MYFLTVPVYEYRLEIKLNLNDLTQLRSTFGNLTLPLQIHSNEKIIDADITTVCSPSNDGYECRCERNYLWPCDKCATYGKCNEGDTCGCIKTVPTDGQFCQSELNSKYYSLSEILSKTSASLWINTKIIDADITTVCSPSNDGYECRCERNYLWPCDKCATYGKCNEGDKCGCIKTVPTDGQFCQSELNIPVYKYRLEIKLNLNDLTQLRSTFGNLTLPLQIHSNEKIIDADITTVCSPSNDGYECRCERNYLWPCDKCATYGKCNEGDTCGCIKTVPTDGQFCQSELNSKYYSLSEILSKTSASLWINTVRSLKHTFGNLTLPLQIHSNEKIIDADITTVCSPSNDGYECRCERNYLWPCDKCATYGKCNEGDTCGCIKTVPTDGQFCQSELNKIPVVFFSTRDTENPEFSTFIPTTVEKLTTVSINSPSTNKTQMSEITTVFSTITKTQTPEFSTIISTTAETLTTATTTNSPSTIKTETLEIITVPFTTTETQTPELSTFIPTTVETLTTATTTNSPTIKAQTSEITTVFSSITKTQTPEFSTIISTTAETLTTATTTNSFSTIKTETPEMTTVPFTTTETQTPEFLTFIPTTVETLTTATTTNSPSTIKTETPEITTVFSTTTETQTPEFSTIIPTTAERKTEPVPTTISTTSRISFFFFVPFSFCFYRQGSVIVDFAVQVLNGYEKQIEEANKNLNLAFERSIGPVLGVPHPLIIYEPMKLTCSSSEVDVGKVSNAVWTFNESIISSLRYKITTTEQQSVFEVDQVIPNDAGKYDCTLNGTNYIFSQNVTISADSIKQAPVVEVDGQRNVLCQVDRREKFQCCVQSGYTLKNSFQRCITSFLDPPIDNCIQYTYTIQSCSSTAIKITCKVNEISGYDKTTTLTLFIGTVACEDKLYGQGQEGNTAEVKCPAGQEGHKTAECKGNTWKTIEDTCILTQIKLLSIESQGLVSTNVEKFSQNLKDAVLNNKEEIAKSSGTINSIVNILTTIANVLNVVSKDVMENVLQTVDVLIGNDAKPSWSFLNSNMSQNASSQLLGSLESLSNRLNDSFEISTPLITMVRTEFSSSFAKDLNSTVSIEIPFNNSLSANITTILLSTFNNVIPPRNSSSNSSLLNNTSNPADGYPGTNSVFLVKIDQIIRNVTLKFKKINETLPLNRSFQCVFWNFKLVYDTGAWDDEGCKFVSRINDTVTCNCTHLTSFSILMATSIPEDKRDILDIITYIGVGISLASLVICLIIEGYVWKAVTKNSTALMRHISIVNTALSLLIADICFIIAASYSQKALDNKDGDFKVLIGQCSAVTFLMHFFYLALFFWMLVSGLLLLYRTLMVLSHMKKSTMIAMGFVIGYGCPLIIAVTTVAATAPSQTYFRKNYICWLNWTESKALLSLVIPALVIVVINIIVVIVVLCKIMRRTSGNTIQPDEKNSFVVILRCLAILTPLFGLTWALGIGTMVSPRGKEIHLAFAFFNSLQVFTIIKTQDTNFYRLLNFFVF
uniref:Adhesion G protein-coupled receptor F5 n=1 Tax=Oryzias latipes TaxID=8090 RepID=A0A3P9H350_ORYLA